MVKPFSDGGISNLIAELFDHDPSVELDQVLEDEPPPGIPARLHKQSAFRKAAQVDRRETELFRQSTNLLGGSVIVARQEHNSLATLSGRILVEFGSPQVVEALDQ